MWPISDRVRMQPCHPGSRPCVATRRFCCFKSSSYSLPCPYLVSHNSPVSAADLGWSYACAHHSLMVTFAYLFNLSFIHIFTQWIFTKPLSQLFSLTTSPNLAFQAVFQTLSFIHSTSANAASMASLFVNAEGREGRDTVYLQFHRAFVSSHTVPLSCQESEVWRTKSENLLFSYPSRCSVYIRHPRNILSSSWWVNKWGNVNRVIFKKSIYVFGCIRS